MLTKNEKEWLEHRDAMQFLTGTYIADFAEYPLWNSGKDWQEAAEFSERVAAKLAKHIHNKPLVCETNWDCPYWPQGKCAWCYLKAARLEVEEEMDADIQAKDKAIQDFC